MLANVPRPLVVNAPVTVTVPFPLRGDKAMFPVVGPPMVKVLLLRDWIEPLPLSDRPGVPFPLSAEILATGVAVPALLINANLALDVAVPPKRTS